MFSSISFILGTIVRIDFHVIIGEVTAPCSCFRIAITDIDLCNHDIRRQDLCCLLLIKGSCHTIFYQCDLAFSDAITISTLSGSNCAPEYPIAHRIRPQFASFPKIAHFVRLEVMIDFASTFAVCLSFACFTCTSNRRLAPSPSPAICFAR